MSRLLRLGVLLTFALFSACGGEDSKSTAPGPGGSASQPSALSAEAVLAARIATRLSSEDGAERSGVEREVLEQGAEAVPCLTLLLDHPDRRVRQPSAVLVCRAVPGSPQAVHATIVMLASPEDYEVAARSMLPNLAGEGGASAAAEDVQLLIRVLRSAASNGQKEWVATALGLMGPAVGPAAEALADYLFESAPYVCRRRIIAWALTEIGPAGASAVPKLVECVRTRRFPEAVATLAKIAPEPIELLREMFEGSWADQRRALSIAGRIGPGAALLIPDILRLIEREPGLTDEALLALSHMGPAGDAAADVVKTLGSYYPPPDFSDPPSSEGELGSRPRRPASVREALSLLQDPSITSQTRTACALFLCRTNGGADALAIIRDMAVRDERGWRVCAVGLLEGGMVDESLELLRPSLTPIMANVTRSRVIGQLSALGARAEPALPLLEELADDFEPGIARVARAAVAKVRGAMERAGQSPAWDDEQSPG